MFKVKINNIIFGLYNSEFVFGVNYIYNWFDKRKSKRKFKKRVVFLLVDNSVISSGEIFYRSDVDISDFGEDGCVFDYL